MSLVDIVPLTASSLDETLRLAERIWRSHYPGIITPAQIDYMLAQRYRAEIIAAQLDDPTHQWLSARNPEDALIGFAHGCFDQNSTQVKLDKLYVAPECQRQGVGAALLERLMDTARARGCQRIELQVNRNNHTAVASYRKAGFTVERESVLDIGNGFVMDDYIMARHL